MLCARRAVLIALVFTLDIAAQPRQRVLWLDSNPQPWNKVRSQIPKAQKVYTRDDDNAFVARCSASIIKASTPELEAISAKGWMPFATTQDGRGVTVVGGMQDFDGMCRPIRYQEFVFVKGVYAGTISPVLMDSRTDGAVVRIAFPDPSKIYAEFARYAISDPLCCASRVTEATYYVQDIDGKPTVTLSTVRTRATN